MTNEKTTPQEESYRDQLLHYQKIIKNKKSWHNAKYNIKNCQIIVKELEKK
jgi:hypothetical protein